MPQELTFSIEDPTSTQEIWKVLTNGSTDLDVEEGGVVVLADAPVGQVSINLPAAADNVDRMITVKKTDSTSNRVLVAPDGSDTIDGETIGYYLSAQYQSVTIISNGANWFVL